VRELYSSIMELSNSIRLLYNPIRQLYNSTYPEIEGTFLINIHHI
jgi:hypothetical protein